MKIFWYTVLKKVICYMILLTYISIHFQEKQNMYNVYSTLSNIYKHYIIRG